MLQASPRMKPPPLPDAQKIRAAKAANIFLPGAGLYLIGHRKSGAILAGLFLACFAAVFGLFLVGYFNYLAGALGDDLLAGNRLEEIGEGFHQPWLLSLAGAGVVIYAIATVLFTRARRKP